MDFTLDNMEFTLENLTPVLQVQLFYLNVKCFLNIFMPLQLFPSKQHVIKIPKSELSLLILTVSRNMIIKTVLKVN